MPFLQILSYCAGKQMALFEAHRVKTNLKELFFSLILLPFHDILRTFFYKNRKRRWIKKENAPSEINPTNCVKHNSVRVVFEHYICCVNWCSILFIVMMTLGHQSTNRIILARFKLVTIKF